MRYFKRRSKVSGGNWRLHQLWLPLYCSAGLLVAAAAVGALLGGLPAAAGAFAGVGIVAASYTVSMLAIAWADAMKSSWVLPVGLLVYVVKFTVIGVVLAAVGSAGWDGLPAMGFGVVVGLVVWIAAQFVALNRYNRRVEADTTETRITPAAKQE